MWLVFLNSFINHRWRYWKSIAANFFLIRKCLKHNTITLIKQNNYKKILIKQKENLWGFINIFLSLYLSKC
jgi:hypothetical protein